MDRVLFLASLVFIVMALLCAVGLVCWRIAEKLHPKHNNSLLTGVCFLLTFFVGAGLAGSALRRVAYVIAGVDCDI